MSSPAPQYRSRLPRIAEVAVERARLTVVPRRRTRAARMPFVALVSIMLLGGVVGLLLFNTSMQQASFAATALESRATTLAAREQTLQMELDRLRDPQRVAGAAQRLGMVPAGNPAFLRLGSGKVTGVPSPGTRSVPFRINPRPPAKPRELSPSPTIVRVPAEGVIAATGSAAADTAGRGNSGDTERGNGRTGSRDGKKNHQTHESHQPQG
jgi:hypothetical protein